MSHSSPRRPVVAAFAGLLLPGLGHVYCGELAKGLALLFAFAFALPFAAWLALHGPAATLWLVVLAGTLGALALYVYAVVSAWRLAKRAGGDYELRPCNRAYLYFVMVVAGYWLLLTPLVERTKTYGLESFRVPSSSMQPTIEPGDWFFADKRVNRPGEKALSRGEIAVFVYPNDRTTVYVKRIIGLPGDRVELDGTRVRVNGEEITVGEGRERGAQGEYSVRWPARVEGEPLSIIVPNAHLFVLGDNRGASHDSRQFGTVPAADVIAVARQVWFSRAPEGGIRWDRLGRVLQ